MGEVDASSPDQRQEVGAVLGRVLYHALGGRCFPGQPLPEESFFLDSVLKQLGSENFTLEGKCPSQTQRDIDAHRDRAAGRFITCELFNHINAKILECGCSLHDCSTCSHYSKVLFSVNMMLLEHLVVILFLVTEETARNTINCYRKARVAFLKCSLCLGSIDLTTLMRTLNLGPVVDHGDEHDHHDHDHADHDHSGLRLKKRSSQESHTNWDQVRIHVKRNPTTVSSC